MNKAVMMSIKPEWCVRIAIGEKTVEVRKTRPKIEPPFKCYIYETKSESEIPWVDEDGHFIYKGRGAVIGEFICDDTKSEKEFMNGALPRGETCLSDEDLVRYAGYDTPLFYWHISDLVIYDTPRSLSDFGLKRPPQSWRYVQET